jgi:hypothetical protein
VNGTIMIHDFAIPPRGLMQSIDIFHRECLSPRAMPIEERASQESKVRPRENSKLSLQYKKVSGSLSLRAWSTAGAMRT